MVFSFSARNYRPDNAQDDIESSDVSPVKTYDSLTADRDNYAVDPLFDDPFADNVLADNVLADNVPAVDAMTSTATEIPTVEETPSAIGDATPTPAQSTAPSPEEIILLHVIAPTGTTLNSKKLKAIFDACDCRFQPNGVFSRFEHEQGKGDIQFTIVNMVEPGTFSSEDPEDLNTPGISLLLCLPGPENPTEAINCMIETAQCIANNLQASIKDENLTSVTDQQLEYYRQQVRNFLQRKLLTSDT